jgi:UTP--glucose-1-phosphate uridylyltransferase
MSPKPIRKAVFLVAGLGTRFLPATKAMPKELLPVIDKPVIQYAVEEALEAGITELVFVTGRTKRAIEDHFDANPELERALAEKGKSDVAEMVRNIVPSHARCIFVRQAEPLGTGHAVLCAEPVIGNDPFAVFLPDDIILGDHGAMIDLVKEYQKDPASILSVIEVAQKNIDKYGIIRPGNIPGSVAGMVEKPTVEEAPSNLASIGRYVFEGDIFDQLRDLKPGHGGEIVLTDAINQRAEMGRVRSVTLEGRRYDCGDKFGYLEAILDFALAHPEFGPDFLEAIKDRVRAAS